MNRRGFLQGLFAAAAAPLVPDVLRPTLLDTLKAKTATWVLRFEDAHGNLSGLLDFHAPSAQTNVIDLGPDKLYGRWRVL